MNWLSFESLSDRGRRQSERGEGSRREARAGGRGAVHLEHFHDP